FYKFFGDPIHCQTYDMIPTKVVETFCWVEGTYTVEKSFYNSSSDVPARGVEQVGPNNKQHVKEHAYYQWVPLFFVFQAITFIIPWFLWSSYDRGFMKHLVGEIQNVNTRSKEKTLLEECMGNCTNQLSNLN